MPGPFRGQKGAVLFSSTKLHIIVGGNREGVLEKDSHDDFDHRKSHGRLEGEHEDCVELTDVFLAADS